MAALIVFCENPACGAIFTASNIIGGKGSAQITFENSRAGPCPRCGGPGRIPDGVYEYSNNAIRFLTGPSISLERLRSVEAILRAARRDNEDKERLLRKVAEASPAAATALKGIPEHTWVQWLAIVIALVSLAIQIQSTYFKKDEKTLEKKFLEHLLQETEALAPPKTPYKRPSPKVPRNDPCPCESGKKYKQCCGLQQT